MIVVSKDANSTGVIPLGRCGENEARQIRFGIGWLIETYGEGTATLVHFRSRDEAPYIVDSERDGDELVWTVTGGDTTYPGVGKCEIRWTVDEMLAKTVIFGTEVLPSITGDTVMPEPLESWYDQMIEYLDGKTVTGAVAETLPAGSDATAEIEGGILTVGIPKGDKGDKGDKGATGAKGDTGATGNGIASIAKTGTQGNVDTYTITMTDGSTTTFDVTNGNVTSVNGNTGSVTLALSATGDGTVTLGL